MKKSYLARVKNIVTINDLCFLKEDDIWEILDISKAIIFDGHFELLSTKHSEMFFRFAAISQYPSFVAKISEELVEWLKGCGGFAPINVVLGPTSQGMFFAYDIARELNGNSGKMSTRAVYAAIDKKTGRPEEELVKGFQINARENVLIVNDMTSTGGGLEKLIRLTEKVGAEVAGICLFANRGINEKKVIEIKKKYTFHTIIDLDMPSWPKAECAQKCDKNKPLIESRSIHHLPIYSDEDAYNFYVHKLRKAA